MKNAFLAALLFLCALPASAQTFVACANNTTTAATATTVTYTSTSGNFLVIFATQVVNNTSTLAITDSASQSWTQTTSSYSAFDTGERAGMFVKANSSSVTSVTATWSGGLATTITAIVCEFSGMVTSSAEDSSVNNSQASSSTATSGSLTTTTATDVLLFGVLIDGVYNTPVNGAGYTLPATAQTTRAAMQYKIVSATQSGVTTTLTWTTARINANIFGGFKGNGVTTAGSALVGPTTTVGPAKVL